MRSNSLESRARAYAERDHWLVFWAIYTGSTLHSSATAIVTSLRWAKAPGLRLR